MPNKYIIALDQGTTSSHSVLFDEKGRLLDMAQQEFEQIFPKSGWVEHNPDEILKTQFETLNQVISKNNISPHEIAAIGITNQRETAVIWDKNTGKSIYNAIVWQDRRTAPICEELKEKGFIDYVKEATGLVIDSYFSGTKVKWLLDNVAGAREKAERGKLLFGTIDSWLVWHLSKGESHVTDYSNASRTMLYNIRELHWDEIIKNRKVEKLFAPNFDDDKRESLYRGWKKAVKRTLNWENE